jgi:hypothetical protein
MQIEISQSNCWVTFEICWEFDLNMNMINNKLKSIARNKLGHTIGNGTMQMEMKCSNNKDDEFFCK